MIQIFYDLYKIIWSNDMLQPGRASGNVTSDRYQVRSSLGVLACPSTPIGAFDGARRACGSIMPMRMPRSPAVPPPPQPGSAVGMPGSADSPRSDGAGPARGADDDRPPTAAPTRSRPRPVRRQICPWRRGFGLPDRPPGGATGSGAEPTVAPGAWVLVDPSRVDAPPCRRQTFIRRAVIAGQSRRQARSAGHRTSGEDAGRIFGAPVADPLPQGVATTLLTKIRA